MIVAQNFSAQISESEPNNPFPLSNDLPENTVMSGQTCNWNEPDRYLIVLPEDGNLQINTQVAGQGINPNSGITFTLTSKTNNPWNSFSPFVGENGSFMSDSFNWCCLLADTFYIEVYRGYAFEYCYDYSFSWDLLPAAFNNDEEPNSTYLLAEDLNMNATAEGHVSFVNNPQASSDVTDFYRVVPPVNGTMRIFVETEAQSTGSNSLNVTLHASNGSGWYDQYSSVGTFQLPSSDTLYWGCVGNDTMYISLFTSNYYDKGYAYRIRYDMIAPTYADDIETNNNFASAQLVDPALPIEGNQYYFGDGSDDVYKFFKPYIGFLKIIVRSETMSADAGGGTEVQFFDHNLNQFSTLSAPLGINGQIAIDSITYEGLASDTFYIKVLSNYAFHACKSYQLMLSYTDFNDQVQEKNFLNSSLYPNPSNGKFNLDTRNESGSANIQVCNLIGEIVFEKNTFLGGILELNFEKLDKAIYIMKISKDGKQDVHKMIIE